MASTSLEKIIKIYETPLKDGKSGFELWEEGKTLGSFGTPSTYDSNYLQEITSLINSVAKSIHGKKILSIGCGNAFIEKTLMENGYNILVTDVSQQALKLAKKKGLKTHYLDARKKFPFKEKFDVIISDGVVGHLIDEDLSIRTFLNNCKAVLNTTGAILIGNDSPIKRVRLQKHEKIPSFYWVSTSYLKANLKQGGYKSIHTKTLSYYRPEYGMRKRVIVWGYI